MAVRDRQSPPNEPRPWWRQLATSSALYGLAGALGKALALLTVPILTRMLSPADYGLADLANTFAAMFAMTVRFAGDIPTARLLGLAREKSERRTILSSYAWATVVTGLAAGVFLLPFAGLIATDVWSAPDSVGIVLLAVALIPIGAVQATLTTTQRLEAHPVPFAALATIDLLAQMILAVAFVALGWGPAGMVAGFVIGSLIGLLSAALYTRALVLTRPAWRIGSAMVREGLAFLPAALGFVVANYAVRYLLVESHGQGAVGLFAVAIRLASGMALVAGAFSMAWGPFGLALPDNLATARLFGKVVRGYALAAVIVSLGIGALGPEIISVISGQPYLLAATMLPGLLMAAAFSGGFYVLLVAAGVSGRGRSVAHAAISGAALQVASTALLQPLVGLQAVGIGAVLGQALALVILVSAVGDSVHRGREAVLVMCAGGGGALVLQALNAVPGQTLPARLTVVAMCLVVAGVLAARFLQRRATILAS